MIEKTLDEIGKDLGVHPEVKEPKGPGRRPGAKGPLPAIKTMPVKQKDRELGVNRKRIRELEEENQKLRSQVQPEAAPIPPALLGAFPSMIHDYLADRFGPHWKLTEPEMELYGESLNKVVARYMQTMAGQYPELLGLLIVVVTTAAPRIYITIKLKGAESAADETSPAE